MVSYTAVSHQFGQQKSLQKMSQFQVMFKKNMSECEMQCETIEGFFYKMV